jgi:hypothetical protein
VAAARRIPGLFLSIFESRFGGMGFCQQCHSNYVLIRVEPSVFNLLT